MEYGGSNPLIKNMSDIDLLSAVQPTSGFRVVVTIKNGKVEQHSVVGGDAVYAYAEEKDKDVYFSVASFKEKGSRKKDNVLALKALWVDIDCGESKAEIDEETGIPDGYIDQAAGLAALQSFCDTTGMPKPLIVNSGRGVHAYWILDKEVSREEWEPLAGRLREVCVAQEFFVDPSVFEVSRVLRVPGSYNQKDTPPKLVSILSSAIPCPMAVQDVRDTLGVVEQTQKMERPKREMTALGKKMMQNQVTKFSKLMTRGEEGCSQLNDCVLNQTTLPEPRWFNALSVAKFCDDRSTAIHKMSNQHPEYDADEVEDKIAHIVGPHTCFEFEKNNPGGCNRCPHKGKIKSPIVLGKEFIAATEEDNEVVEEAEFEGEVAVTHTIPTYPFPYYRGQTGGVYRESNDEEDDVLIYEHDLYVVKIMSDPNCGDVVLLKLHLPMDGVREFVVPATSITEKRELRRELSMNGVMVAEKPFAFIVDYIIKAVKELQTLRRAEKMRIQFGWADNDKKFIIGTKEIAADGIFHSPASTVTAQIAEDMEPMGTLEKWKEVMELYNHEGHEGFAFAALTAFGSPLLKFLGQNGAIINVIHPKSGTGKTTTLHMCNSVYGHPDRLCSTWQDTLNAKIFRLGVMNNLPYTVDEITNLTAKDFSTLAYCMSQGRGKDRMKGSANEMRINHTTWQAISLCSSNASFNQKLSGLKASPEGELMRLIEYKINYVGDNPISTEVAKKMFDHQLMENYGHAGDVYLQHILGNMEEVVASLQGIQKKIDDELKLTQRERFWSAVLASNITGGLIAKRLGLITWDMKAIYKWSMQMIHEMRDDVAAPLDDASGQMGLYMNSHVDNMLVVNNKVHASSKNTKGIQAMPMILPKGELLIRYEPDTQRTFIARSHFRAWCVESQTDVKELINDLEAKGVGITIVNKRLSKGMKVNTPAVYTMCIDSSHPDFVDMDAFVEHNKEEVEE